MKVCELFEGVLTEDQDIQRELEQVRQEMSSLKMKGGSLGHGGILPQYIDQMKRLKAKRAALLQRQSLIKANSEARTELGNDWEKDAAEKFADPTQKADRNSQAISQGLRQTMQVQKELGGYAGIANDILDNIDSLTDGRKLPLEMDVLADRYGVGVRTIHKWFERPEFIKLRRFMPHMYR